MIESFTDIIRRIAAQLHRDVDDLSQEGFLFIIQEFETLKHQDIPLVVTRIKNAMFDALRRDVIRHQRLRQLGNRDPAGPKAVNIWQHIDETFSSEEQLYIFEKLEGKTDAEIDLPRKKITQIRKKLK